MSYQTVVLFFLVFVQICSARPTDGLQNFELLKYTPVTTSMSNDVIDNSIIEDQRLARKCVEDDDITTIRFEAYSKNFSLHLQKVCQSVEEGEELLSSGDFLTVDDVTNSVVYFQGYLEGESNSTVDGTIENGVFQGVILTEDHQKFIIERLNSTLYGAHSFIYSIHSKEQVIAALFAQGETSGQLPTEILDQQRREEIEGSGQIEASGSP